MTNQEMTLEEALREVGTAAYEAECAVGGAAGSFWLRRYQALRIVLAILRERTPADTWPCANPSCDAYGPHKRCFKDGRWLDDGSEM